MKIKAIVNNSSVTVGPVRLAFVNVFEPRGFEGSDPKYSVTLLLDKNEPSTQEALVEIKKAIESAKQIASQKGKFTKGFPANGKLPLKDGDKECNADGDPKHAGYFYINANSNQNNKPEVVDKFKNRILDRSEIYGGCYAIVSLNFYGYDTPANKGISCGLNHVMKFADGEPFGGRVSVNGAFDGFDLDIDEDVMELLG